MNIEKLAIEIGIYPTGFGDREGTHGTYICTLEQLEAIAKAYADNQEMYLLKVIADIRQAMGNADKLMLDELAPTIAKAPQQQSEPVFAEYLDDDDEWQKINVKDIGAYDHAMFKTRLLFTQPPNTVSLEQYNKLLDALKHSRMTLELANLNELITDTIWASKSETLFDFMDSAIAEAEGK